MIYQEEQLQEAFNSLPESVQQDIMSTDNDEVLSYVASEYSISDEKRFRQLVFALLVGELDEQSFLQELETELQIMPEIGEEILEDITSEVIAPVEELLKAELQNVPTQSAVIEQAPEPVHTLDLEIPPQNLPMVETEEQRKQFLRYLEHGQHTSHTTPPVAAPIQATTATAPEIPKPEPFIPVTPPTPQPPRKSLVDIPSYKVDPAIENSRAASSIPRLNLTRSEPPQQFQEAILAPHYEKPEIPKDNPVAPAPTIEENSRQVPKFSYHDKDPYREPPEA